MQPPKAMRPKMQNYGISTQDDGMLDWSWAEQRLIKAPNYWLATTQPDGRPHAAPVWGVWLDQQLIFGVDRGSRKARNLQARADVIAHLESGDEVVIVEGRAAELAEGALLTRALDVYAPKYGFDPRIDPMPNTQYLCIVPSTVLGWLEKDFPTTATRWVFGAK